jgi:hypothetical protein
MKIYPKILVLVCFLGVLGWASILTAEPISYSSTTYVGFFDGKLYHEWDCTDSEAPCDVGGDYYRYDSHAAFGAHSSEATASSGGNLSAVVQATYKFTSTFPAISIQYDYILRASASAFYLVGSGQADLNSYLMDTTTGNKIWSDDQIVKASAFGYGEEWVWDDENNSGSTSKILALTLGHDYELFFSCSSQASGVSMYGGSGGGSAEMRNIQVEAVPIPSTLMLFSTGLLGLLQFQKRWRG